MGVENYYKYVKGIRKNSKLIYWIKSIFLILTPLCLRRWYGACVLRRYEKLNDEDKQHIDERVAYYCRAERWHGDKDTLYKLADNNLIKKNIPYTSELARRKGRLAGPSTYFFDSYEFTSCFPQCLHWNIEGGDVNTEMAMPTITKSRPIGSRNNVLLNLDKLRHFLFFKDPIQWKDKESKVLFRGVVLGKTNRQRFIDRWQNHTRVDAKDTGGMSLYQHLHYKYIMALEGNDVASNLKWVMATNSIAVMPKPRYETWFMEGKLIPNYHYICIADDYHDLIDKIDYYDSHPDKAAEIIKNAHEWIRQFQYPKREQLIGMMVMREYLSKSIGEKI